MALKTALIGYSGFVGGNLREQHRFDDLYNSQNIESIEGHSYSLIVCAGAPAEKWKANQNPGADRTTIHRLMKSLAHVHAERFVLISTVDVYPTPIGVNEASLPDWTQGAPYGRHRRELEEFTLQHFSTLVVRLPGLFGKGLKKNIIYDFLHGHEVDKVHADAQFQFYSLESLWADIQRAQKAGLTLLNMATEPVTVEVLAARVFGLDFKNRPAGQTPARYDMRSLHAGVFGGENGYLQSGQHVLSRMSEFVMSEKKAL